MSCVFRLTYYGLVVEPAEKTTTPQMLASSMKSMKSPLFSHEHILASKEVDGPLCRFRKGFFDHLKPRLFGMSTIRVVMQQGTLIIANYMSDQLERDIKRNQLVQEGEITQIEADDQAEEWEKVEWGKRWKAFPRKLLTTFAKYHVVTLLMRTYEHLAAMRYDKTMMDKLTMDPFFASRRIAAAQISENKTVDNSVVAREMFYTTFWGNLIAFMADYSVHQVIVCYGYYTYVRRKRQQAASKGESIPVVDGPVMTSLLRKSTQLLVSRGFGLVCTGIGGAVGTIWWPGWGTILLSNMGEGAATMIMDDGQSSSKTSTQTSD